MANPWSKTNLTITNSRTTCTKPSRRPSTWTMSLSSFVKGVNELIVTSKSMPGICVRLAIKRRRTNKIFDTMVSIPQRASYRRLTSQFCNRTKVFKSIIMFNLRQLFKIKNNTKNLVWMMSLLKMDTLGSARAKNASEKEWSTTQRVNVQIATEKKRTKIYNKNCRTANKLKTLKQVKMW